MEDSKHINEIISAYIISCVKSIRLDARVVFNIAEAT